MHLECIAHPRTLRIEEEKVFVITDSFPAECNLLANLLLGQLAVFATVPADLLKFINLPGPIDRCRNRRGRFSLSVSSAHQAEQLYCVCSDFELHNLLPEECLVNDTPIVNYDSSILSIAPL